MGRNPVGGCRRWIAGPAGRRSPRQGEEASAPSPASARTGRAGRGDRPAGAWLSRTGDGSAWPTVTGHLEARETINDLFDLRPHINEMLRAAVDERRRQIIEDRQAMQNKYAENGDQQSTAWTEGLADLAEGCFDVPGDEGVLSGAGLAVRRRPSVGLSMSRFQWPRERSLMARNSR